MAEISFHCSLPPAQVPRLLLPSPRSLIVCLGSPSTLPEAVSPLIGSVLVERYKVIGTVAEPCLDVTDALLQKPMIVVDVHKEKGVRSGHLELRLAGEAHWSLLVYMDSSQCDYGTVVRTAREVSLVIDNLINIAKAHEETEKRGLSVLEGVRAK